MNILTDPSSLKDLMRSLNLRPKDYMGQNFLVSEEVLQEIVDVAEIKKDETIVEIGPGLGVLTGELVKVAGKVIAIEKDKKFVPLLRKAYRENKNLEIIESDVLKFNFEKITGEYKIVANIPYYLTSHLIQMLLALKHKPNKIVLMVQKEVGERLVAEAGELSLLGISVQMFADVFIAVAVPKENFWPKPKVDSCVVVIEPKEKYSEISNLDLFFRMLKIAFAGKRKQIHNTLANGFKWSREEIDEILLKAKINAQMRPQELEISQWVSLYEVISRRQG